MKDDQQKQKVERVAQGTLIATIGESLERFNGNLSDDRKVRLFAMSHGELKKLATDVARTQTGLKAIALIVAAITASEQERK